MTTAAPVVQVATSTDALFRAWGAAFNTALAAVGLVQTADTWVVSPPRVDSAVGTPTWS